MSMCTRCVLCNIPRDPAQQSTSHLCVGDDGLRGLYFMSVLLPLLSLHSVSPKPVVRVWWGQGELPQVPPPCLQWKLSLSSLKVDFLLL